MCGMQLKQFRILTTLLLAFAIAQAGLGSGYLDGVEWLLIAHTTNAFAVFVLAVLCAVFGFAYRRGGGPAWTFYFPLIMVGGAGLQVTLGFANVRGGHVFFGVLFLSAATLLCSYAWRLRTPAPEPAPGSSARAA